MPDTQANFTEVFELQVDVPGFTKGLNELKKAYDEFVAQLGDSAQGVLGAGSVASLQQQYTKLEEVVQAVYQEVVNTQLNAEKVAVESAQREDAILESIAQKRVRRAKEVAEAEIEASRGIEGFPTSSAGNYFGNKAAKTAQDIDIEAEGLKNKFYAEQVALQEKLNVAKDKTVKLDRELTGLVSGNREDILQKEKVRLSGLYNESLARTNALRAELSKLEQSGLVSLQEQVALTNKLNSSIAETTNYQSRLRSVSVSLDDANQSMFERFVGGMKQSIVHLTRFYAEWMLIIAAVDAARELISLPFKALAEGMTYMRETEKSANDLLGVLLNTSRLSENTVENFKLMGAASKEVVKYVQDAAIAAKVGPEQTLSTLKALLEGGIAKSVSSLRQAVDVAVMFQSALKATGVGALAAQGAINEIVKLINGTVEPTNKFLVALGMSVTQWEKIREEGTAHKDLVQRLAPLFEKYAAAIKAGGATQAVIIEQLDVMRKRLEAVIATPFYERLSAGLSLLNGWLLENKDKIAAFGQAAVGIVTDALDGISRVVAALFRAFGDTSSSKFLSFILTVRTGLVYIVGAFEMWTKQIIQLIKLLSALSVPSAIADIKKGKLPGSGIVEQTATLLEEFKRDRAEFEASLANTVASNLDVENTFKGKSAISGILDQLLGGGKGVEAHSRVQEFLAEIDTLKKEYADKVESLRESSKEYKDSVDEAFAAGTTSSRDAAKSISNNLGQQQAAAESYFKDFITRYNRVIDKIKNDPATGAKEKNPMLERLNSDLLAQQTSFNKFKASMDAQKRAADKQGLNEERSTRSEHNKWLLEMAQLEANQEVAIAKWKASNGIITELEAFDKETKALKDGYDARRKIAVDEANALAVGRLDRQRADEKVDELDKQYTHDSTMRTMQRIELLNKEREALENHLATMRRVAVQEQEIGNTISKTLYGNNTAAESMQLYAAKNRELDQLTQEKERRLELAKLKNEDSAITRKLTEEVEQLHQERLKLLNDELVEIKSRNSNPAMANMAMNKAIETERRKLETAAYYTPGLTKEQADEAKKALDDFNKAVKGSASQLDHAYTSLSEKLAGFDVSSAWENANGAMEKLSVGANAAAGVLGNLGSVVDTYKQGSAKGGTMGGIGAVMNQFSSELSAIPVVGQFMPAISGVLSFVGGLFTAAAKRIAEDVKKSFQKTLDEYSNGSRNLVDTINLLEQQRADAISRLSGKKGGKDQLDQLLPEFDKEIQQLQKQQLEIKETFETSLDSLRLHSDTLAAISKQWADINKQVKDYLGAGGDATKAAEYLSLQLEKIKQDAIQELSSGEQQAIQDAIQLNDLLQQRVDLVDQYNRKRFDLINQDAIERRQAGSVVRGQQLKDMEEEQKKALDNIDAQISLTTKKLDKEKQVFDLSSDIADLHRRDEELTLEALDLQIKKWNDLKTVIQSISMGDNGNFMSSLGMLQSTSVTNQITVQFNGNVNGDANEVGSMIGDGIAAELDRQYRMAPGA